MQMARPSPVELCAIKGMIAELSQNGHPYSETAKLLESSKSSVGMLMKLGRWKKGWAVVDVHKKLNDYLGNIKASGQIKESSKSENKEEILNMLNEPLKAKTLQHFNLEADPFDIDEMGEEPWIDGEREHAIKAIVETAMKHKLTGIIGESGAGKSVVLKTALRRLDRKGNVNVIRLDPNLNEDLSALQLVDTMLQWFGEALETKKTRRIDRVQQVLIGQLRSGHRTLLVIEEAHMLKPLTLRGLKRLWEWVDENGQRLLGIVVVGQPGLEGRATGLMRMLEQNLELREVAGRMPIIYLEPLEERLGDYLRWRIRKVKDGSDRLFAPDAIKAMRTRLNGGSLPMLINILASKCLNEAARREVKIVDAGIVERVR